jgi:uncharacterized protein YgiM (DUF1202 family)
MQRKLLGIMVGTLGWAGLALAGRMSVQVQDGQVRKTPSFLGAVVVKLPYGTAVEAQPAQNGWVPVQTAEGQQGWIHQSALTTKKIVLASGGTTTAQASSDELALAGKGFNSDVEKQFKQQNPNLNFAAVERMLKNKVAPREMQKFLDAGRVQPAGGAK